MSGILTPAWSKLRYHRDQDALWRNTKRFCAVVAGRGSGKTELARRRVIRCLPIRKPWSDPIYFFALPTYNQAKRVAWAPLKSLVPPAWVKHISESDLTIETIFGSKLFLLGLDKPARAEGVQWDGGVIDESSDQKPGVFDLTFMPTFSHRNAWCWRIGIPKRFGPGAREFKRFFDSGVAGDPDIASFQWPSADIITPEALEIAKRTLSDIDFAEQFEASWEQAGGRIFHAFGNHNIGTTYYYAERDILVGSDFNVNPMAWTLAHKTDDGKLEVFDEIFLRDTNTPATLDYLWKKYGAYHKAKWIFCGDASGRARKSAAATTDYLLIKNDERFKRKKVLYPRANPMVQDRFASCNAMFRNAAGEVRLTIDPRCKQTIEDLNNRAYKEGTREPDDSGDVSHCSDALGYTIHVFFPIKPNSSGPAAVYAA